MRDFNNWLAKFRASIADYKYYVDFDKVYTNVDAIKIELHILNSLIGSKSIETDFLHIIESYPQVLKCIPILLAKRQYEISASDSEGTFIYNFNNQNYSLEQYLVFMRKTGLFDLLSNHLINNLVDYVLGVEVGLDSNGRKNRGGDLMENIVESYLKSAGFSKNETYFKEMTISEIESKWGVDLSCVSNQGKNRKTI